MSEGRVADVVAERESFGEIDVQAKRACHGSGDLRYLNGVGKPVAEVVGEGVRKDLGFVFEAAESSGVYDAIAITLKIIAVRVGELRVPSPARALHGEAQMR